MAETIRHGTKGTYIGPFLPGDNEAHKAWDTALAEFSNRTPPRSWTTMTPLKRTDDAYYRWDTGTIDEEGNPIRCADGQECLAPHYPYDERLHVDPYGLNGGSRFPGSTRCRNVTFSLVPGVRTGWLVTQPRRPCGCCLRVFSDRCHSAADGTHPSNQPRPEPAAKTTSTHNRHHNHPEHRQNRL